MKYIKLFSRTLLGLVFIFSGFVKAVDPLGYTYKIADYFTAFRLEFLEFTALPLSILISCFELLLGIALLLGYRRKISHAVLLWFMLFFTVLTFILAIFNPVTDCGCFGDALILTNWETFLKNLVLMVFVAVLYLGRRSEGEGKHPGREWIILSCIYLGVILFSVWNFRHLPLLDFRAYDVGTVIREEMEVPDDAPVDEYETILVYRNLADGEEREFSIADYPKDTLLWEFVSSDSKLLNKGYEAPIHDFAIMDENGFDLVDGILADPGYTLLMISYDLEKAPGKSLELAGQWFDLERLADDYSFMAVSASGTEVVEEVSSRYGLAYPIFAGDEIMLKTMVRSNPGFMLIGNGSILGKWGFRDFPGLADLDPSLPEKLENASGPISEEEQLLMEAGAFDGFSFGILEFSSYVPDLIYKKAAEDKEKGVIISFILGIAGFLLLAGLISPIEF